MHSAMAKEIREEAACTANRDDAELWRWFCLMYEEGRVRWCASASGWLVSVDHRHLATEPDFDAAMRTARQRFESGRSRKSKVVRPSVDICNVTVSIGLGRVKAQA